MRRFATALAIGLLLPAGCVEVAPGPATTRPELPTARTTAAPGTSLPVTQTAAAATVAPPPTIAAGESGDGSIVYILDSNVWLAAPDGSAARQLTTDGAERAYHDPGQAADGSIYALRGSNTLVHLDRLGRTATEPVTLITLENGAEGLSLSPDGTRIAYVTTGFGTEIDPRFGTPTGTFLYGGTDIAATDGTSVEGAALANMLYPAWADADTLVVADGVSVYTADVGGDPRPWIDTSEGCITEFDCPSGAPVSSSLSAATVSRDMSVVAYVSHPYFGDEGRVFAPLSGPPPAAPGDGCLAVQQAAATDPGAFSPDSQRFAFDDTYFDRDEFEDVVGEGIFVMDVEVATSDCGASSAQLVIPGGSQPDWSAFTP